VAAEGHCRAATVEQEGIGKRSCAQKEGRLSHAQDCCGLAETAWRGKQPNEPRSCACRGILPEEEAPAAKKQKVDSASGRGFVQELLDKAPKELQTCRSLLVFLDKKLEAAVPEKPAVGGPQALKARLEAHAEGVGRLAGLRAPGGWDARAKRVLDITAAAATTAGEAALKALEELLEKESKDLDAKLKDTGDSLEAVTKERQAWAKDTLRRNWLAWCAKLLKAREVKLLADVEGEKVFDDQYLMTSVDVLEAVLAGTTA